MNRSDQWNHGKPGAQLPPDNDPFRPQAQQARPVRRPAAPRPAGAYPQAQGRQRLAETRPLPGAPAYPQRPAYDPQRPQQVAPQAARPARPASGKPARPAHEVLDFQPPQKKRHHALGWVLSALLLVVLLAAAVLLLPLRGNSVSAAGLRTRTNTYRVAVASTQNSLVNLYQSIRKIAAAFTGTDQMSFSKTPEKNLYVDNSQDDHYFETPLGAFGRMIVPEIGTNAPLYNDSYSTEVLETNLYYGVGLYADDNNVVYALGHRFTTKATGMYHAHHMKVGDPFFLDDYKNGIRYVYVTESLDHPTEAEINSQAYYVPAPFPSEYVVLITCDPLIYNASDYRIAVKGKYLGPKAIPEDDESFNRYLSDNDLERPVYTGKSIEDGSFSAADSMAEASKASAESAAPAESVDMANTPGE